MVEGAQSYEMVRNFKIFKAFVMFAVKNWKPWLSWYGKFFSDYAYVSPENFFDLPPSTTFREKFVRLGKYPRKCWSNMTTPPPPPPPMLMASRRPWRFVS